MKFRYPLNDGSRGLFVHGADDWQVKKKARLRSRTQSFKACNMVRTECQERYTSVEQARASARGGLLLLRLQSGDRCKTLDQSDIAENPSAESYRSHTSN